MRRLYGLDALRGVAALFVLAQHILSVLSRDGHEWAGSIITTVDLGKFGVAVFFLISGFVIPFSLRGSLAAFGISRAARLLPALWLSILLCLALGAVPSGAQLFANAFMLTHLLGQANLSDPYWTLNWEMYFYGITALIFAAGRLHSPGTFGLLALGFAVISLLDPRFSYLIFMLTGTLLRMVLLEKDEATKVWLCASIGALVGACSAWAMRGDRPAEFFVAIALALPMFLMFWNRATHPAMRWLGNISYSLYLFHLPILQILDRAALSPVVFCILGALLPTLVAAAVYRWVERPMIGLSKAATTASHHHVRPA